MRLIMVRHGETEDNLEGIIQGHRPGKLTRKGIEQARELASQLKHEKIDIIFSSDLQRAKETTREIAKLQEVPINYTSELRERNLGVLEGKKGEEYAEALRQSGFKPQGGESFLDFEERVIRFLDKLRENYNDKTVLIISHGGFIRVLLGLVQGKTDDEILKTKISNASVNIVEV